MTWKRTAALALATAWIVGPGLAADPEHGAVDAIFAEYDSTRSPGCSMAVYRDGAIAYARGYGMANLEYSIANAPDTVFRIGSTSKQFTAMAIALLAEEGKLSLDDDIHTFFPELPDYGAPVTVRNLVHHTSGLRDYLGLAGFAEWGRDYSVSEALAIILRQKELNFRPGTEYLYSNSNYFLMSQIVEKVTGQSLRDWAEERIFGPLGMKHSHFHDDHTHIVPRRADGYAGDGENGFRISMTILDMVGDGGVYTTVEDLLLWDRNFYDNRLGKGGPELIDLVTTPAKLDDGESTGYGFGLTIGELRGVREVAHGGAFVGYRAGMNRYPDHRLSVAVLCNYANTNPTGLARQVAELYLADALEPAAEQPAGEPAEAEAVEVPARALERVTGEYWNPETYMVRSIAIEDGVPFYDRGRGSRTELAPLDERTFRMIGVGVNTIVRFEPRKGRPEAMIVEVEGDDPLRMERFERAKPSAESLAAIAGQYYSEELDHRQTVRVIDGALTVDRRDGEESFEPLAEDVFVNGSVVLEVERDGRGAATGFRLQAGRIRNLLYVKQ